MRRVKQKGDHAAKKEHGEEYQTLENRGRQEQHSAVAVPGDFVPTDGFRTQRGRQKQGVELTYQYYPCQGQDGPFYGSVLDKQVIPARDKQAGTQGDQ